MESAIRPGELAVEAFFPAFPGRTGTAFVEISRRHGDYAVCGVAAAVTVDGDGLVTGARSAFLTMGPAPAAIDVTEAARAHGLRLPDAVEPAAWQAVAAGATATLEPDDDIHATAAYRAALARVLAARALAAAAARASFHVTARATEEGDG
jgi:carbon-monoxide dehydrogenase medium subunit